MLRPFVKMYEKEEEPKREELLPEIEEISALLDKYLDNYIPETYGYTKHSIMGPVGKLLSIVESGRIYSKEALLGYIINIHEQSSQRPITNESIETLGKAIDKLIKLRERVSLRTWIKLLREIDYAVYKKRVAKIVERIIAKKGEGGE